MRRAARRDANEPALVAAARAIGIKVFYTNELGDLIVQLGKVTELWEVKTETGTLTKMQCLLRQQGLKARTVRTVDDVLHARNEMLGIAGSGGGEA
jgi:hypothetical protein